MDLVELLEREMTYALVAGDGHLSAPEIVHLVAGWLEGQADSGPEHDLVAVLRAEAERGA